MKIIEFKVGKANASVVGYLHHVPEEPVLGHSIRPAILICPGGAYRFCSEREAEPVALAFLSAGFQAFVLNYSCGDDIKRSNPLREVAETIDEIKKHSEEWYVEREKIAVCGFSAGGHLAASLATLYKTMPELDCKPSLSVLCYPVISSDPAIANEHSFQNIAMGDEEVRVYLSLDKRVVEDTVPTFIWHIRHDSGVNVGNTLKYINALWENGVDFEAHIFEDGPHGISLCNQEVNTPYENTKVWFELALKYLSTKWDWVI